MSRSFFRLFGTCGLILSVVGGYFLISSYSQPKTAHASAYTDAVTGESTLLYYWPMTESSGTSLAATVGGTALTVTGATVGTPGQLGNAVSFDGINDSVATAATLNLTAYNKIVVEALVEPTAYDGTPHYTWEFSSNLTLITGGFQLALDGGGGGGGSVNTTNTRLIGNVGASNITTARPLVNAWHHVVAVYDKSASNNEVSLYVDGNLQTVVLQPTNANNTNTFGTQILYLMSRAGSSLFTAGKMQQLAIYSDLSASRIAAHAQATGIVTPIPGVLTLSGRSSSSASFTWTNASSGAGAFTAQLQRSPFGANSWSNVSGVTASPGVDNTVAASTDYDYRVAYTDTFPTTVYSNTVSVKTGSDSSNLYRAAVQAEPTLLNYWPLDETSGSTALPLAGTTNLTFTGATPNAPGEVDGPAMSFDGVNDFAATSSTINLTAYNKIVVEALMKIDSYDKTPRYSWEFSTNMTTVPTGFNFSVDGGSTGTEAAALTRLNGNTGFSTATYPRLTLNTWHHVVTVYNKGLSTNEVDVYVDGVLQSAIARPTNANNTNTFGTHNLYLMSRAGTSLFVPGDLQHVAIYSDLSPSEILAHAQASGAITFAPGTLTEDGHSDTTATLTWTNSTNGTIPVTTQLQRSPANANTWTDVAGATQSGATDTGLTKLTSYDYRVAYTDGTLTTLYSSTVTVTTNDTVAPLAANTDKVIVAPYDTPLSGTGNVGTGTHTSKEFLEDGHTYRIRQTGTVNRIRLYTANTNSITGFYLKIWRKDNGNFNLVGTSENLAGSLTNAGFSTIDLASPIANVHEGDYYGFRIESTGSNVTQLFGHTSTGVTSFFIQDQTASSLGMAWEAQSSTTNVVPIEIYMQAPQIAFIGDSLMGGRPANWSFLDTTDTTSLESTTEYAVHLATNYSYQNMGISGNTTFDINSRFTTDLLDLHPRIAVIEGGANDFATYVENTSKTNFLTRWTNMLTLAQASDSISQIVVVLMYPSLAATNTSMTRRDDWNASLRSLAADYSKAVVVDPAPYIGQFRSGGTSGNLWDLQDAYASSDGVHLSAAGYAQVGEAILDALDTTAPTVTSITSSNASGTYTIGQTISLTATFSENVTSVGNVTLTTNTTPARTCTFTITNATTGSCSYIVRAGDAASALDITVSGTLKDKLDNAMTSFTPAANLSASKTIVIDTFVPPVPPSAAPTITQPVTAGDTAVAGTSSEADGTDIEVFVDNLSVGTTTVTGGAWSKTLLSSVLQADETVTTIATADAKNASAPSSEVVVLARTSPAPVVSIPTAGDTVINGTSTGADNTSIEVFRTRDDSQTSLGFATVTGGNWTLSGFDATVLQAGDTLTAKARIDTNNDGVNNSSDTYSSASSPTVVSSRISAAPAVAELLASATSISGTSTGADGTVIEVFVNTVSVGTTTVTSGAWTLSPVAALVADDEVTATATFDTNNDEVVDETDTPSAPSSTVIVAGLPVSSAPAVGSPLSAGDTVITGTSIEADSTTITVYVNGVSVGTTTVSGGAWTKTVSSSELQATEIVTATALASGKTLSAPSTDVGVSARTSPAPTVSVVTAADTAISGTSSAADGTVIEVFNNHNSVVTSLGTTTVTSNAWTLTSLSASLLQGDDVVTAQAKIDTNNDGSIDSLDVFSADSSDAVVQDLTSPAPTVVTPSAGASSISGTSFTQNGTVIEIFRTRSGITSSLGTTTVTGNSWTLSGLDSATFHSGDVMTAKARIDTNNDGANDSSDTFSAFSSDAVIAALGEKDIVDFSFPEGTGVIEGTQISVVVPYGSNITALVPTITISGLSLNPASGVAQDFSNPVVYRVTAADSTTQDYTVTVAEYVTPPTITGPVSRGTSAVSGTAPGVEDGAIITLYRNGSSFGTTTVTGHAWTFASTGVRFPGDRLTATVTADTNHDSTVDDSDTPSDLSTAVTVLGSGGTVFVPSPDRSGNDDSGSGEVIPPPSEVPPPVVAPGVPVAVFNPLTGHYEAPDSSVFGNSPFDQNLNEAVSQLASGWYIRSPNFTTVYYVTPSFTRQPFWDAQTYFTWADSFVNVVWVRDATLPTMSVGSPVLPKAGVVLIKTPDDPKVYAITTDSNGQPSLRYIPDEATAQAVYGSSWADYVIDVASNIFHYFTTSPDLTATEHIDTSGMKKRSELYQH